MGIARAFHAERSVQQEELAFELALKNRIESYCENSHYFLITSGPYRAESSSRLIGRAARFIAASLQHSLLSAALLYPLLSSSPGVSPQLLDQMTQVVAQKSPLLSLNDVSFDASPRGFWTPDRLQQLRKQLSTLYTSRSACNKAFESVLNQGGVMEVRFSAGCEVERRVSRDAGRWGGRDDRRELQCGDGPWD